MIRMITIKNFESFANSNSFMERFETFAVNNFPAIFQTGSPAFVSFLPTNSGNAAVIGSEQFHVFLVLMGLYFKEIVPTIVDFISVIMIDLKFWPRAGHVKPGKYRGGVLISVDTNSNVAHITKISGNGTNSDITSALLPDKKAGQRVVVEKPKKSRMGYTIFRHFHNLIMNLLGDTVLQHRVSDYTTHAGGHVVGGLTRRRAEEKERFLA